MGRKSIAKDRKGKSEKTRKWAEALLPQLQERTLDDLTMDDLAEMMGKSKSTLYQYFPTKAEWIQYAVEVHLNGLKVPQEELFTHLKADPMALEALKRYLILVPQGISAAFLIQLKGNYPIAWKQVWGFLNALLEKLKGFYALGIDQGYFRNSSLELLIALDQYFISQLITDSSFFDNTGLSLTQVVSDYLNLRFEGLLMEKYSLKAD